MITTAELRHEIKRSFAPYVQSLGFELVKNTRLFIEFRRQRQDNVHFFDIQFEKYGQPRFIVNYGTSPSAGLLINNRHFPPSEIVTSWLPDSGRLLPGKGETSASWFRQDNTFITRIISREPLRPATKVISELLQLFQELEVYWNTDAIGSHMRVLPRSDEKNMG